MGQQSLVELLGFFHDALLNSLLVALILAPLGLFLHLRRTLFLGAALPHLAGFGFVLGASLGLPEWPSGFVVVGVGVLGLTRVNHRQSAGLTLDAWTGLVYVVSLAGIMLTLALTNTEGHAADLLLKGSVLTAGCTETRILGAIGLPLALLVWALRRRLMLIALDPQTAAAMGIRVHRYEVGFFAALGTALTLTLSAAGAMACFGFLLLPALTALALCDRVAPLFVVAPLVGAIGAIGGLVLALWRDLPPGPVMVAVMLAMWLGALIIRAVRTGGFGGGAPRREPV